MADFKKFENKSNISYLQPKVHFLLEHTVDPKNCRISPSCYANQSQILGAIFSNFLDPKFYKYALMKNGL